jgi:drug/metabolite transporter (DMT)-like permease
MAMPTHALSQVRPRTLRRRTPAAGARSVDVALLAVAVAWGSSYLAAKSSTPPDAVFAVLALRFTIAGTAMVVVLLPRLSRLTRAELSVGGALGLVLALIFTLETFGVTRTSAANAGLIISLTILMTPVLQGWVSGRALPGRFLLAASVAVTGVLLLIQADGLRRPGAGDVLMFLAAAVRAAHVVLISRLSHGRQLDSARLTTVQIVAALLVFSALAPLTGPSPIRVAAALPADDWMLLLYLGLACTVLAFFVQTWAVRATSPARVSLLLGTEPLWAFVVALTLSGRPWTVAGLTGGLLVLLGVGWGRSLEATSAVPPPPPPEKDAAAVRPQAAARTARA